MRVPEPGPLVPILGRIRGPQVPIRGPEWGANPRSAGADPRCRSAGRNGLSPVAHNARNIPRSTVRARGGREPTSFRRYPR